MTSERTLIFHMCRREEWSAAVATGAYVGSSQDVADGFIHLSGADQVVRSAAKHRAGQTGLLLLVVAADTLGPALKWEASRSGKLFPHLYGELSPGDVEATYELPLGADGQHVFPEALGLKPGV